MTPPRQNIAIAIDGGGTKGLIVAQALIALEKELGGKPLIEHPNFKILTGTSTGTIITAGIALGMSASAIADMYEAATTKVFPPLLPMWLPGSIKYLLTAAMGLFRPSLYSADPLKNLLRNYAEQITGNPDFTLGDLGKRLRPDQALIATVVDVNERRTRFLKSYQEHDAAWKLWEVVLASSSVPTILPVVHSNNQLLIDGGIGSYSNPAYVAAHEGVEWGHHDPASISLFSFGTGWLSPLAFEKSLDRADRWNILDWARNMPTIIAEDAIRTQSLDMIDDYLSSSDPQQNMDYRRFQLTLNEPLDPFTSTKEISQKMRKLGDQLAQCILNDQHALGTMPGFDPEGLRATFELYRRSRTIGMTESVSK
jgi:predicted acylesterase/phospholipase RssA